MSVDSVFAAAIRKGLSDLDRVRPRAGQADLLCDIRQQFATVADLLEGKGELVPPTPVKAPKPPAKPVVEGTVIHAAERFQRKR